MEITKGQLEKIEEHLCDILNECQMKGKADLKQIEHDVFEITKHLKLKDYK